MGELKHGATGYRRGCRCDTCRDGQREKQAARRRQGGSGAVSGSPGPVVPSGPVVAVPGPLETKIAAEIAELAGQSPWTRECARLEEQATVAARIVDQCMSDGRLHLTTAQHKVIRDALADLKLILAPVREPGRRDGRTAEQIEADEFVNGLTAYPAVRKPDGSWQTLGDC